MIIYTIFGLGSKVIAFFPIDGVVHVYLYASVTWMSNVYVLLTFNLKTKKKVDAIRSSFVQLWFEHGEFWKAYSPYSVLLLQKKEENNWSKGKVFVSSLRQKCHHKTPVLKLVRPIPWWWFFSQRRSSLREAFQDWRRWNESIGASK